MGDDELLRQYARSERGSDQAFRLLVDRYAALVYSTAQRRLSNHELAQEIAQNVFTALARKAPQLESVHSLGSWLHRATMLESARAIRTECRRNRKIDAFKAMSNQTSEDTDTCGDWNHVIPHLDEALHKLSTTDRDLIFQHYFEERSYAEIAKTTGRTKSACAKRCSRVLNKLCGLLKRQGVTISAAALGAGITHRLAHATPGGLAQQLSSTALSSAAAAGSATFHATFLTLLSSAMTASKLPTIAALIAMGAALPLSIQWAYQTHPDQESASMTHDNTGTAATPVERDGNRTPAAARETTPQGQNRRLDLQLLERELKQLPFPDKDIRRELDLERLMFELDERDVPAVTDLIDRLEPDALIKVTSALFARWAEFDPNAAATRTETLQHKYLIYAAREGVMTTWAASDPDAALAYLAGHPKGTEASNMVWATIGDMTEQDPKAAIAQVEASIDNPQVLENVRRIILEAWSELDPDAAMAWVGEVSEETRARSYSKAIIERLASGQPERAFELALESPHPAIKAGSARWTLMQWMGQDPVGAAEAFSEMPPGLYTDEQMMRTSISLAGELTKRDPEAALGLAARIPEGPARHHWLYGTAWELANTQPEQAAKVAEDLAPSGYRRRALNHVGKQWLDRNPASAQSWIAESGLFDAEAQAKLLHSAQP